MSLLSTFTGGAARNYLQFALNNPNGAAVAYTGFPQYTGTSGGAGAAYGIFGTYNNLYTDSRTSGSSVIYPVSADTIIANHNIRLSGGTRFDILGNSPCAVKSAGTFKIWIQNTSQVFIADGAGNTNFTDLSIEIGNESGGFTFNADPFGGNNGYTPNLANITCKFPYLNTTGTSSIKLQVMALTAQSVENILVALDEAVYASLANLSVNLSGGTSSGASALTAAASAARTSLLAKGIGSITLNP